LIQEAETRVELVGLKMERSSSQISETTQNLVEKPSPRVKKKAKRRPQRWHGNVNGDKKYFLQWPLRVPMVQGAAKTSRKLRAYTKGASNIFKSRKQHPRNLI
jgi:hypothetical protein